jgi:hypothetical protein
MPTPLQDLFQSNFETGTHKWNVDVFRRAYLYSGSQFDRVISRVRAGFSVLVYLPGNSMRAAAQVLRSQLGSVAWKEYGLADDKTKSIADVWRAYTGLFTSLSDWIRGADASLPYAIFHNLDMLADGRGGLDTSHEAKTALFFLTECSRSGVVLGLSDVSAGQLPETIRRPFGEEVWLDEIPLARFPYLVPLELGKKLAQKKKLPDGTAHPEAADGISHLELPDGTAYLLASRLRWTDPSRAMRIMDSIGATGGIENALAQITAHTMSVVYSDPASLGMIPPDGEAPPGYERTTIEALERSVIEPFKRWTAYVGNEPHVQVRSLPSGIIFYGPPGTGKSQLARWLASRIRVPFRQVSAADLKRADWGLTERLVRDLFRSARQAAPCMIVLDDADDLLRDREEMNGGLASAERGVVNAFLQEMEGFGGRLEGVLVVLTTNQYSRLDKAADSRLTLKFKVPYPLDKHQIGEIVIELGRHYGIKKWPDDILDRLKHIFFQPLEPVNENVEVPAVRYGMNDHLFSPREISAALRMMMSKGGVPGHEDVGRMERHYRDRTRDRIMGAA